MTPVIVSFVLIVILTTAISLAILHWQYQSWPPCAWKQRLLRRVADLRDRRRELTGPDPDNPQAKADRLAADSFRRHLRSVSTDRLDEHPGIGPGTVERVRGAGGRNLDDLTHLSFESIHGIGPGKANDLRTAVANLVREARSRFDAGGCPEAQELRKKLANLNAAVRERAASRQRELAAVEAALSSADEPLAAARDVTFWNYLFRRGTAGPTDEVMNRPLPTVNVLPPLVPLARPAPRPTPPPIPTAQPAVARPTAQPAAFPPSPPPKSGAPSSGDIFADELQKTSSATDSASQAHPLLPKLVAYVRFAFMVAKTDGRIAQAEKKVIRTLLDEQFGHDAVLVRHIDPLMERTQASVPSEAETIACLQSVTTAAERRDLYRFAERIADASGERNQRESDMLARIAVALSVSVAPSKPPPVVPTPASAPLDPRAVLEIDVATTVTADLVRRRYTLLTEKLDATKAAALGPEFARMAAEKRTQLRTAAELLLAPFGEPLEKPVPPPPTDLRHNPDLDDVFGG
jgi:uncharacterized tellurite resistance protein B-like protein